ncbi:aspartyl-phosphate phosphatase Spo0E family protein [Anaerovirgula multivorans]|uniref:aspartyl-phosphate phosphatase Spo0E family protein n=1 Tax=Anaerovirgula multivorans TaxID=312168 RepID=UPI0015958BDF
MKIINHYKQSLKLEIEDTRFRLLKLIQEKQDNLLHSEVIKLSKQLDQLLVKYSQDSTK